MITGNEDDKKKSDVENLPLVSADSAVKDLQSPPAGPIEASMARLSPTGRRTVGFIIALLAGLCYGSNFDPPMVHINCLAVI